MPFFFPLNVAAFFTYFHSHYDLSTAFGDFLVSHVIIFAQASNFDLFVKFNESMLFFKLLFTFIWRKLGICSDTLIFVSNSLCCWWAVRFWSWWEEAVNIKGYFVFDFFNHDVLVHYLTPIIGPWKSVGQEDFRLYFAGATTVLWECISVAELDFLYPGHKMSLIINFLASAFTVRKNHVEFFITKRFKNKAKERLCVSQLISV